MNYFLIKLSFLSAVHFGSSDSALSLYTSDEVFHADTLFSALCHTALALYGPEGAARLCRAAEDGRLLLSDAMPWMGERCYLPKPIVTTENRQELPANLRKAMKKLAWIPVDAFGAFSASLSGGEPFDPASVSARFSEAVEVTKVNCTGSGDHVPYQVGLRYFLTGDSPEDCGLYIILACDTAEMYDEWLGTLITALGHSGIGGKTSAGYGRFEIADEIYLDDPFDGQTEWLLRALTNDKADSSLLLTASLPREEELETALEGASFQLLRRGGFLCPDSTQSASLKKQTQYFLAPGSVLKHRFQGALYSVCPEAGHPVYRYSRPIFLGVAL